MTKRSTTSISATSHHDGGAASDGASVAVERPLHTGAAERPDHALRLAAQGADRLRTRPRIVAESRGTNGGLDSRARHACVSVAGSDGRVGEKQREEGERKENTNVVDVELSVSGSGGPSFLVPQL